MHYQVTGNEYLPAIYEFLPEDGGKTLRINIQRDLVSATMNLMRTAPLASSLKRNLNISSFIPPQELPWGFGAIFITDKAYNSSYWHSLLCELPQFFNLHTERDSWSLAFGVIASIDYLLACVNHTANQEKSTDCVLYQSAEIYVGASREDGRTHCSISAGFSPHLCRWISQQNPDTLVQPITTCMTNAYLRMYGQSEINSYDKYQLGGRVNSELPYLTFYCPGDRCSLYPATRLFKQQGYELASHNVDSPMQQLVLLMGIAALAQQYREATP